MAPKAKKKSTTPATAEITFIGGQYNNKTLRMICPTPPFIVLAKGTELYVRVDPEGVVDATYKFTDNWQEYETYRDSFSRY